jgi:hypothetical protein
MRPMPQISLPGKRVATDQKKTKFLKNVHFDWKNDEPLNFRYFSTLGQSQKSWQENRKATGNPGTSHGADGTSKLTGVTRKMWTLH